MVVIRAPHGRRSRSVKVAASRKTPLETALLVLARVGFVVPTKTRESFEIIELGGGCVSRGAGRTFCVGSRGEVRK